MVNPALRAFAEIDVTHMGIDHTSEGNPQDDLSQYIQQERKKLGILSVALIRKKQFVLFMKILIMSSFTLPIADIGK